MTDLLDAQGQARILCVDDEWVVRAGLSHLFAQQPGVEISGVASVDDAFKALDAGNEYDLIILDLKMPGSEPFTGLSRLYERVPTVPIIVFSVCDSREDVLTAVQHGAMGYLTKATPGHDIKEAVTRVLAGEVWLPRSLLSMENARGLNESKHIYSQELDDPVERADAIGKLTKRQREIFDLLAQGKSNRQIAFDIGISEHTVRVHMTAILRSLGVRNRTQAAVMAAAGLSRVAESA